jgi:hypothetical protein
MGHLKMADDRDDEYGPEETVRRMKRALQRAFSKPPQPHGRNPQTPPTPKERPASQERGKGQQMHKTHATNLDAISPAGVRSVANAAFVQMPAADDTRADATIKKMVECVFK